MKKLLLFPLAIVVLAALAGLTVSCGSDSPASPAPISEDTQDGRAGVTAEAAQLTATETETPAPTPTPTPTPSPAASPSPTPTPATESPIPSPSLTATDTPAPTTEATAAPEKTANDLAAEGEWVTSSYRTAKYYYHRSDSRWKRLKHQVWFDTVEDLLAAFPNRRPAP